MVEDKKARRVHSVTMNGRGNLVITGVTDIDSFDEDMVAVFTDEGELVVRGTGLHIGKIDVDSGELDLDGQVNSVEYTDNPSTRGNLWSRLFR